MKGCSTFTLHCFGALLLVSPEAWLGLEPLIQCPFKITFCKAFCCHSFYSTSCPRSWAWGLVYNPNHLGSPPSKQLGMTADGPCGTGIYQTCSALSEGTAW